VSVAGELSDGGGTAPIVSEFRMASIQLSRYEAEEGDLPDVCMYCGEPATERKRRRFISHPLWVYLLLPWGYVLYAIVAAILTEHIRCYTLFCPRHKNYWLVRNLYVWGSLVLILILLIGGFILAGSLSSQVSPSTQDILFGSCCIGSVVLLLGWLISIPISQVTAIHPANATEYHLTLKRVSPAFVEAVRLHRAEHKGEIQAEEYREHFRPRRSPPRRREGDDERIERS
jgi:hypothetical protein